MDIGTGKMAEQVKAFATKAYNLSVIPGIHKIEEEKWSEFHTYCGKESMPTHIHTQIN